MKYLISVLALAASLSASAKSTVYPQVINMIQSVQVQVYNSSEEDVTCSGVIFMQTIFGQSETHFYNENVNAGLSSYRFFQLRNFNDRLLSVSHTITCREDL